MELITLLHDIVNPALKEMTPSIKPSDQARKMLLTIAQQESGPEVENRYQMGGGPARGLWQFERIGVLDVMTRARTEPIARNALRDRKLPFDVPVVHEALAKDDRLAAIFARLNLWNDPHPLRGLDDINGGFATYLRVWRPGAWTGGATWQRYALRKKWTSNWERAGLAMDAEGPMP